MGGGSIISSQIISLFYPQDFGNLDDRTVLWGSVNFLTIQYGLIIGLLAALWYGAFEIIQHYTLRLIFWYTGDIPRNYAHFLDYATNRVFLQKVGGGYIFIHRLLMEHFASLTPEEIEQLAADIESRPA